mmetsp:Transcript_8401/g.17092  ORF Transcript_8401/g.17092 Transcript_8401/m.17092 type:complete len:310 (-) Transcript_8401:1070-1999(-)
MEQHRMNQMTQMEKHDMKRTAIVKHDGNRDRIAEMKDEKETVDIDSKPTEPKDGVGDSTTPTADATSSPPPSLRARLGQFVEMSEVQLLVVVLLYLDVIASALLPIIATNAFAVSIVILAKLLEAFSTFAQSFFVLEMLLLAIALGFRLLTHVGYLLDMAVISATFYGQARGISPAYLGILSLLRFWRIGRLVSNTLDAANKAHDTTKSILVKASRESRKLKAKVNLLEETRKNDTEHRREVEGLAKRYKAEVDMLAEALRIAAADVAGAGAGATATEVGDKEGRSGDDDGNSVEETPYVDEEGDEFYG